MGFSIQCTNKGCGQQMDPVLDKSNNTVICTACGKEIKTVTEFAKRQMLALGQIKREEKKRQAWAVKCEHCNKEAQPKLDKSGKKLLCSICEKELTKIAKPFAQVIKQNLSSKSQ